MRISDVINHKGSEVVTARPEDNVAHLVGLLSSRNIGAVVIADDDGNGELKTTSGIKLSIGEPDCPGDGTVPLPSGEAPGKLAVTEMVGKSTLGNSETGKAR